MSSLAHRLTSVNVGCTGKNEVRDHTYRGVGLHNLGHSLTLPEPTACPRGSAAKVEVLAERARLGQQLWHPADTTEVDGLLEQPAWLDTPDPLHHIGKAIIHARKGAAYYRVQLHFDFAGHCYAWTFMPVSRGYKRCHVQLGEGNSPPSFSCLKYRTNRRVECCRHLRAVGILQAALKG